MKKVLLIVAALFLGLQAKAQLIAEGGYMHAFESANTLYRTPSQGGLFVGARYHFNLEDLMDGLYADPGLNLSILSGKAQLENVILSNWSSREIALNMPLHVGYKYEILSDFSVYGFLGPTLQLGLMNNIIDRNDNASKRYNMYKDNGLGSAPRTPFNLYLGLGGGIEVAQHFRVNVAFDFGLLNLTTMSNARIRRNILKIGVGYAF